jgi:hypothetical protein
MESWPVILLGWPAILSAIALSIAGIVRKKPNWLIAPAILLIPISLYLAGTPRFRWIALVVPILLIGASIAVRRSNYRLAWALIIPFIVFFGWLAMIVLNE